MKKVFIWVMFFLLLSLVSASSIDIFKVEQNDKAIPGSIATFRLSITNKQSITDTFRILPDEFSAVPFSDSFEYININPSVITLNSGESKEVDVNIKILGEAIPNKNYRTYVTVVSKNNPKLKKQQDLIVNVIYPKEVVKIFTDIGDRIIPGEDFSFNLFLSNSVNKVIKDAEVFITSELFEEKFNTPLYYGAEVKKELAFDLDPGTEPGIYTLDIKVYSNRELQGSYTKEIIIVKNPDIQEKIERSSDVFISRVKVIKKNVGNLIAQDSYRFSVGDFANYFTTYSVPPSEIKGNELIWNFEIMPGQSYEIEIVTDYRGFWLAVFVLVIIVAMVVYILGRKVTIKKTTYKVRETKDGVSELKVLLHVRNKDRALKNITIMDYLPSLIHPAGEFGTLKPKIQKGRSGIRFVWHLDLLEAGEERVLSYNVKSKLNIVGNLMLPSAVVVYKKKGKKFKVKSKKFMSIPLVK